MTQKNKKTFITKKWKEMYAIAKSYYETHGDCNFEIGSYYQNVEIEKWMRRQRNRYSEGKLSQEQIKLLNNIEIVWDKNTLISRKREEEWHRIYNLAKNFYKENGHLHVPSDYCVGGIKLQAWISNQRSAKKGYGSTTINNDKIKLLEKIGIAWDTKNENEDRWNLIYNHLKDYYYSNGNILVPIDYVYKDINVWNWLKTQRDLYKKEVLSDDKKNKLDIIGMNWNPFEDKWMDYYNCCKKYYERYKNVNIPDGFIIDNLNVGRWLSVQKQAYKWRKDVNLTQKRIKLLENIGIDWEYKNSSQTSFGEQTLYFYLKQEFSDTINRFKKEKLELDVYIPSQHIGFEYDGYYWHKNKIVKDNDKDNKCKELGIKLVRIREKPLVGTANAINYYINSEDNTDYEQTLSNVFREQFKIFRGFNIDYDKFSILDQYKDASKNDPWYIGYYEAEEYFKINKNLLVPKKYITKSQYNLGNWIRNQRSIYNSKTSRQLSTKQIDLLNKIDMVWQPQQKRWEEMFLVAKKYYEEHGNLLVPQRGMYYGVKLGVWINGQRNNYKNNKLSEEAIKRMENIGMIWNILDYSWDVYFKLAKDYYLKNMNLNINKDYVVNNMNVGAWIQTQRNFYKKGKMSIERIEKLNSINMIWGVLDHSWETHYKLAKEYYEKFGDLLIPADYIVDDIFLGSWIGNLREMYKGKSKYLTPSRIEEMENIGMVWNTFEYNWNRNYLLAKKYYEINGNCNIAVNYVADGIKIGKWVKNQKKYLNGEPNSRFTDEKKNKLEMIGIFTKRSKQ